MPFQPFSKSDRLGKAADITGTAFQSRANRYQSMFGAGDAYAYFNMDDEQTFSMVHSKKKMEGAFGKRKWQNRTSRRDLFAQRDDRRMAGMGTLLPLSKAAKNRDRDRARLERRWQRRWAGRQRPRNEVVERTASVDVKATWKILDEIELSRLAKLTLEVAAPKDLHTCGSLDYYDPSYDRVKPTAPKEVRATNRASHSVTTTEDPNIRALAKAEDATVFATDTIMAAIMCCHRSVYSWDVVVNVFDTPNGKKIFFDKREDSDFDYVTVDETATVKDTENDPIQLAQEATYLNKVFSQMVLKKEQYAGGSFKEPHPFGEEDEPQASVGYRYRKWLVGDVNLVARTEHDAVYKTKEGRTGFMSIKALNEYKRDQKMDWRRGLGAQSGAVLATELKNNSCKIARWTIASMLSGSSILRLGYLSRKTANPQQGHVMLGSTAFKPRDLAAQTSLNMKNGWAILKEIISVVQKYDQGKYVLLKDPNKPVLRLYSVPQNSFEDDDSSEEEEEEEEGGIGIREDAAGDDNVKLNND
jgi:translation initiation factor 3 subunit D